MSSSGHVLTGNMLHTKDVVCSGEAIPNMQLLPQGQKVRCQFYPQHDLGWLFRGLGKEGEFLFSVASSEPDVTGCSNRVYIVWKEIKC